MGFKICQKKYDKYSYRRRISYGTAIIDQEMIHMGKNSTVSIFENVTFIIKKIPNFFVCWPATCHNTLHGWLIFRDILCLSASDLFRARLSEIVVLTTFQVTTTIHRFTSTMYRSLRFNLNDLGILLSLINIRTR